MAKYNQPEEYYQKHGFTKLKSGSGPHLDTSSDRSFDVVEKTELTPAQPIVADGKLTCYQRTKTSRYLFTWKYNKKSRKFSRVSKKLLEITYGPLVETPCPKALIKKFETPPELIDEDKYDPCPEGDPYETKGKEPDDFYNEFFKGRTVRVVQRTATSKGNIDLLDIDGFVYAKVEMESGNRCFRQYRHIKARLYWTFCPRTGWHLQKMDYYVNLWGPWQEIPCEQIPKGTLTLSSIRDK